MRSLTLISPLLLLFCLVTAANVSGQATFDLVFVPDSAQARGIYVDAHQVKRGETLYSISRQYDLSVAELKELNGLAGNVIHPGQRLVVRPPQAAALAERQAVERGQAVPTETPTPPQEEEPYPQAEPASYVQRRQLSEDALRLVPSVEADTYVERKRYYEVKSGEDIYTISERFGVLVEELREWNALIEVEPGNTIVVGKEYTPSQPPAYAPRSAPAAYAPAPAMERVVPERTAPVSSRGTGPDLGAEPPIQPAPEASRLAPAANRPVTNLQDHAAAYLDQASAAERHYLLGSLMEEGRYARVEHPGAGDRRFYAVHKTLPPGTRVRMAIPGNAGFLEMEVIARLAASSEVMVGLSPACVQVLEGAGAPAVVTLFYD